MSAARENSGCSIGVKRADFILRPLEMSLPIPDHKTTTSPPVGDSSGTQACAACKYRRRRCVPNCPLAPHFPADRQREFRNAHKLFGVHNLMNTLKSVQPYHHDAAMKSMIYQANVRAADPVGGCYRVVRELEQELVRARGELDCVLRQLAICRAEAQLEMHENPSLGYFGAMQGLPEMTHPHQQQHYVIADENENHLGLEFSLQGCNAIKIDAPEAEDIINPSLRSFHERQPASFESRESIESSEKEVVKGDVDSVHLEQENELKDAASLFSLTNRSERSVD
ncbi:hypothetical protein RJ639_042005 [Escallonia herrerae]|uniref:LOB domain-containing protein n=1 Tax=Escallonia herrerae TaxID=1293975 RepID=A0AA89B5I9_9ASTE|nr:hypothetical protein RJ639_042005 [Escallonia herrerae]